MRQTIALQTKTFEGREYTKVRIAPLTKQAGSLVPTAGKARPDHLTNLYFTGRKYNSSYSQKRAEIVKKIVKWWRPKSKPLTLDYLKQVLASRDMKDIILDVRAHNMNRIA